MKTIGMRPYLAAAIVAGLLSSSLAAPARASRADETVQAIQQDRAADENAIVAPTHPRRGEPALPSPSGSAIVVVLVFEPSQRALPALSWDGTKALGGLTSHGIPDWLYCFLHKRWCQS